MIRNDLPSGAAEIENGSGAHQKPFVRKRQMKNWPGAARILSSRRPTMCSETTPGPSCTTSAILSRWRKALMNGTATRQAIRSQRREVEELASTPSTTGAEHVAAGRDLVEPAERDSGVRGEVNGVPELVGQASPRRSRPRYQATSTSRAVPTVAVIIPGRTSPQQEPGLAQKDDFGVEVGQLRSPRC